MQNSPIVAPFGKFAPPAGTSSSLFAAITAACRLPEPDAVRPLLDAARIPEADRKAIASTAHRLIRQLREAGPRGGVDGLVQEYALSSDEGVSLMRLSEALLRIPDKATRDELISDKIGPGDWRAHLGRGRPIFVNAASWGLAMIGRVVSPDKTGARRGLARVIDSMGRPVIRRGVNIALAMLGKQFVTGETIGEALSRSAKREAKGFTYSYDMLGEAAMTMRDADRFYADYESAIHAIGKTSADRGIYEGAGISIKLSALHPRYERAQADRVMAELLPRVRALCLHAKSHDIGLNIDAEEADRLELSLNILEALALDPQLAGWQGLGFVVQAYGKRCPFVIDWIIDLAKRSRHRIMVRLVKGAYWDTEIKRAQVDGLTDFPVFTRKVHTDVSYIACARKLLAAREIVYPQFATHNAQLVATIYHLAGDEFAVGDYEFQCLHGIGEALFDNVVGENGLARPCRIYAPVGTHKTLLPYLVRRLLENGANSSFINQIWNEAFAIEDLARDPVDVAEAVEPRGSGHPRVRLPRDLYSDRKNSRGLDLNDEKILSDLSTVLRASLAIDWRAAPSCNHDRTRSGEAVTNPGDRRDVVGQVVSADRQDVQVALRRATNAFPDWAATPVDRRASILELAANTIESEMETLAGLMMREAGKSAPNAIAEVREAVDFLRYYAQQARVGLGDARAIGPVVCISPWNFPLAIFIGQVAAALVTGNTVLAKPAEETPLTAARAVAILHAAGAPIDALQLVPGNGAIGASLVAATEICGVIFTGSTEVAKLIEQELAKRTLPDGSPIPLIAETGGQNAMVVDSSALPEQVIRDVLASAFDSAGQRCSALRILCVQHDIADGVLEMLRGGLAELRVGATDQIRIDIGPVISQDAQTSINAHIERMREMGNRVEQLDLGDMARHGTFVAPTIVVISDIGQLGREVFGPVLHVLRYRKQDLGKVVQQINATGYGLTFGLHSRIDRTAAEIVASIKTGNIYINRNMIGAIVGSQPFGGRGLSGTGPKAGGPLYLNRLVARAPRHRLADQRLAASLGDGYPAHPGQAIELPGPVGESNVYSLHPRGRILLLATTAEGLTQQLDAVCATGNSPVVPLHAHDLALKIVHPAVRHIEWTDSWIDEPDIVHVLIEESKENINADLAAIARKEGPIPIVQTGGPARPYRLDWMLEERSISIDTTAAGGNISLMATV